MPYITQETRNELDVNYPAARTPETSGELNFCITQEIKEYLDANGLSYQTINDIVGALEGAKAEFQRRVVTPYEDKKIQENGDVY